MTELQRYLYWWGLRREARAYIKANSLRAVASAMYELDRHAQSGDHRCAICRLRGALIEAFCRQGRCLQASLEGRPAAALPRDGDCDGMADCAAAGHARLTFLVEGRHYTWRQPLGALAFIPEGVGQPCTAIGHPAPGTCLWPRSRDALLAVVFEYLRLQGLEPARPNWLPTLRQAIGLVRSTRR